MQRNRYYLAYGSNLNVGRMLSRCPFATPVGVAVISNHALYFKKSKTGYYATVEAAPGESVPAVIWSISRYDEENLDYYEGAPDYYYKMRFKTQIRFFKDTGLNGTRRPIIYLLPKYKDRGTPSLAYFKLILSGYRTWGFSMDPLLRGLEASVRNRQDLMPFYSAVLGRKETIYEDASAYVPNLRKTV